jgi:hypothetical protein
VNVFDGPAQDPYAAPQAPEWLASAHAVATCAEVCLGPALVGVYLHGSAALGGWLAHVSDLDILVVTDGPATRGSLVTFGEQISGLARSGPASGIELSVIDRKLARDPRAPWNFLLHVAVPCDPRSSPRVVFDDGAGDPDLLMHIAVTRAAGVAVRGPDAADLFGDPARHSVLAYLASELEWLLARRRRRTPSSTPVERWPIWRMASSCPRWQAAPRESRGCRSTRRSSHERWKSSDAAYPLEMLVQRHAHSSQPSWESCELPLTSRPSISDGSTKPTYSSRHFPEGRRYSADKRDGFLRPDPWADEAEAVRTGECPTKIG